MSASDHPLAFLSHPPPAEQSIQAIPTRYAGCHFRSRLEARWAVFFDALGIRWEYEPQGFEGWYEGGRYLPDFHLPGLHFNGDDGIYVEVKPTKKRLHADGRRIGCCIDFDATPVARGLLILGPIPDPRVLHPAFSALWWRKGVVHGLVGFNCWSLNPTEGPSSPDNFWSLTFPIEDDGTSGVCGLPTSATPTSGKVMLIAAEATPDQRRRMARTGHWLAMAFTAARSARFEHGQNGAT